MKHSQNAGSVLLCVFWQLIKVDVAWNSEDFDFALSWTEVCIQKDWVISLPREGLRKQSKLTSAQPQSLSKWACPRTSRCGTCSLAMPWHSCRPLQLSEGLPCSRTGRIVLCTCRFCQCWTCSSWSCWPRSEHSGLVQLESSLACLLSHRDRRLNDLHRSLCLGLHHFVRAWICNFLQICNVRL